MRPKRRWRRSDADATPGRTKVKQEPGRDLRYEAQTEKRPVATTLEKDERAAWDRVTRADVQRAIKEYDQLGPERFFAHATHAADHDRVSVTFHDVVARAVEGRDGVLEQRNAGLGRHPNPIRSALPIDDRRPAREPLRQSVVARGERADAERWAAQKFLRQRRAAIDADEDGRRVARQRRHRRRGEAKTLRLAERDDADAAGQPSQRFGKSVRLRRQRFASALSKSKRSRVERD
jgi:hypothetical protein